MKSGEGPSERLVFEGKRFPHDVKDSPFPFRAGHTVAWRGDYLGEENERVRNPIRNEMGYHGIFKISAVDGDLVRIARLSQTPVEGRHSVEKEVVVPAFYVEHNNLAGHDG